MGVKNHFLIHPSPGAHSIGAHEEEPEFTFCDSTLQNSSAGVYTSIRRET